MRARTLVAIALAALLGPAAAKAQVKRETRARSPRAAAARTSPAPAGAHPASASATPASDAPSVGVWAGAEWGDHISGFQLRVNGEMAHQRLSPRVSVSFVGSLGFARSAYTVPELALAVNRVKLVPAARVGLQLSRKAGLHGDAGLGLHYTTVRWNYAFLGKTADSGVGLLFRFGAGAWYSVTPRFRVLGEVMLDPTFGTYHENSVAALFGLMFRT